MRLETFVVKNQLSVSLIIKLTKYLNSVYLLSVVKKFQTYKKLKTTNIVKFLVLYVANSNASKHKKAFPIIYILSSKANKIGCKL